MYLAASATCWGSGEGWVNHYTHCSTCAMIDNSGLHPSFEHQQGLYTAGFTSKFNGEADVPVFVTKAKICSNSVLKLGMAAAFDEVQ